MIAVTGHTSGIGKAVYEAKTSIGFSKSTGYNLTDPVSREKIIEKSRKCSLFINCAHAGFGQVLMLKDIFNAWKDERKHIVNIGVAKTDALSWELVHESYPIEKLASHAMCDQLQQKERICRITNLCLGKVENFQGPLSYNDIINAIDYIHNSRYEVRKLCIY